MSYRCGCRPRRPTYDTPRGDLCTRSSDNLYPECAGNEFAGRSLPVERDLSATLRGGAKVIFAG